MATRVIASMHASWPSCCTWTSSIRSITASTACDLEELVRSYLTLTKDLGRVMTRVKAIYRSWSIPCTGKQVYAPRHRSEWLPENKKPAGLPAGAGGVVQSGGGHGGRAPH